MGDHRISVKVSLIGRYGQEAKIDWWLNWTPDKPEALYRKLVEKAQEVGLKVEDKTNLLVRNNNR